MNKQTGFSFIKNAVFGILVITPIAVIFLFLVKLVEVLEKLAVPLGLKSSISVIIVIGIVIVLVLLFSFIVGSIVNRLMTFEQFEGKLLTQIPGYEIVSNVVKGFGNEDSAYPAALVKLYGSGAAVFAFVMEENANDLLTIFVPSTPAMTVGTVYIVNREYVALLDASAADISNCVSQWGVGTKDVLGESIKIL